MIRDSLQPQADGLRLALAMQQLDSSMEIIPVQIGMFLRGLVDDFVERRQSQKMLSATRRFERVRDLLGRKARLDRFINQLLELFVRLGPFGGWHGESRIGVGFVDRGGLGRGHVVAPKT